MLVNICNTPITINTTSVLSDTTLDHIFDVAINAIDYSLFFLENNTIQEQDLDIIEKTIKQIELIYSTLVE